MNQALNQQTMPALFIGHGSPMNAIAANNYTATLNQYGASLPRPEAILCVSAHWMTEGTFVTNTAQPRIIYDFYGFPDELYKVQYPAKGSPEAALFIQNSLHSTSVKFDNGSWGLDHGTWSVMKHLFPKADIPVLQLSLDVNLPPSEHLKIGQELGHLRDKGIMIIGSGNIVHNLRQISWDEKEAPFDWALSFDSWFKENLKNKQFQELATNYLQHPEGKRSVPTSEHYLPALYIAGAARPSDRLSFITEEIQNGSISMTSFCFS